MQIPSFHDGSFDGFKIGKDQQVQLYLTTCKPESFVLTLEGVLALRLTEIKAGNIILDVVIRSGRELTISDMEEVYGVRGNPTIAEDRLKAAVDKALQLLEINPSYGAEGLFLFRSWKLQRQAAIT